MKLARALVRSLALVTAALAASVALLAGCFTPPALLEAESLELPRARELFHPPADDVTLALDAETALRGFFVEADPGAPVVLHLLESSSSVAGPTQPVAAVAAQLADLGYSSLMLDYAGVGISVGERSCANLERDARAMWDEALRRAGGDAAKVHVRATSIGTLALGALLEGGARPASVTLLLPVMADTVVQRFGRTFHGYPGQWIAWLLYDDVVDVDLAHALENARVPMLVMSSPDETFIDPGERARLRAAVEKAGGTWCERPGGHLLLTVGAHDLFVEEARFLAAQGEPPADARLERMLGALPEDVRTRFDAPDARERLRHVLTCVHPRRGTTAAALALAGAEPLDAFRLARHFPRGGKAADDLESQIASCDLSDPAGALPIDELDALCLQQSAMRREHMLVLLQDGPALARSASARGGRKSYSMTFTLAPGVSVGSTFSNRDVWARLRCDDLPVEDGRRRFTRVMMKLYGIPDRVRRTDDGRLVLEERVDGVWKALSFDEAEDDGASKLDVRSGR